MDLTITSQPKEHYLLITSKGKLSTSEELLEQSQLFFSEIIKYDFKKILFNETKTELPLNLAPYFDLVKKYSEIVKPEVRTLKIVVVVSKKFKEVVSSWETICHSRGLHFYTFTSFKIAEKYLLTEGEEAGWPLE